MAEMPRHERFKNAEPVAEAPIREKPIEEKRGVAEKPATVEQAASAPAKRRWLKRSALAVALLAGVAGGVAYGHHYWTVGRFEVSTDDAYVKADYTTVAPKVSGYVAEALVQDNQRVVAGQALARIDDRDFRAALAQVKADVEAADAAIANLEAQIVLQQSVIEQARASVAVTQASLKFASADADRYRDLTKTGAGTVQRAQQTESLRDQAVAQLTRDQAALIEAQKKVGVLTSSRDQAKAQADRARAAQNQAELNLGYTTILAAVDGVVGARSIRVGQYVTAGTQLMAVVPTQKAYVVANFKETQLVDVKPGQHVKVEVDGLPGEPLKGRVDSVSPASGLEFALLPPDNATGNFTKIVQRIPVKITIEPSDRAALLRAGMSVEPTIDTREVPGGD